MSSGADEPEYLTGATAYYPAELTWQLIARLTAESCKWILKQPNASKPLPLPDVLPPVDHSGRPKVQQPNPLNHQSRTEQIHQIGSLRDVAVSVEMVPGHRVVGGRVRELLETYLAETPSLAEGLVSSIGGARQLSEILTPAHLM